MSDWTVVPCLLALRTEFNAVSPNRDKGADGTIGNAAHDSSSDHTPDEDSSILRDHDPDSKNEVHALDIDSTGPWPEPGWFAATVMAIVAREKARWEDANDTCRLEYVIWDHHIYSRAYGFAKRVYSGNAKDPHTNHAHFSARYLTISENDTSPWGVEDDMALDTNDKNFIVAELEKRLGGIQIFNADGTVAAGKTMGSKYALGILARDAGVAARGVKSISDLIHNINLVDSAALAAALAPTVNQAIAAALENAGGAEQLTVAGVETALRNVLRQGTGN